jgi:hypothetical protein
MYRTHHQPSGSSDEDYQEIEDSMKPLIKTQCMKTGFNRVVRSVSADQSVA